MHKIWTVEINETKLLSPLVVWRSEQHKCKRLLSNPIVHSFDILMPILYTHGFRCAYSVLLGTFHWGMNYMLWNPNISKLKHRVHNQKQNQTSYIPLHINSTYTYFTLITVSAISSRRSFSRRPFYLSKCTLFEACFHDGWNKMLKFTTSTFTNKHLFSMLW